MEFYNLVSFAGIFVILLLAATLACLMTACVAGTFYSDSSVLLGR